jgi:curved DNA-binding protein CbpA
MNPYLVLDLPTDAGDGDVRAAYQRLLRKYPPEHQPVQFQKIQEAYGLLRTSRDRWRWKLLHLKDQRSGPVAALEEFARLPGKLRPPGAKPFQAMLKSCAAAAAREAAKPQKKR